jgi:hypothetical protein
MDCCGNTFRREPISRDMTGGKFKRWPMRSTIDRERHSGGIRQRKCLPINYTRDHDTVLRRPVESAQFTHIKVPDGPPDSRFVYLSDVLPTAWQAVAYADIPDRAR